MRSFFRFFTTSPPFVSGCVSFPSIVCAKNFKPWQLKGQTTFISNLAEYTRPYQKSVYGARTQGNHWICFFSSWWCCTSSWCRSTSKKWKTSDEHAIKWKIEEEKWRKCCWWWPFCSHTESTHWRSLSSIYTWYNDSSWSGYCLGFRFSGKWYGAFLYILYIWLLCSDNRSNLLARRVWCYSYNIPPFAPRV